MVAIEKATLGRMSGQKVERKEGRGLGPECGLWQETESTGRPFASAMQE